MTPHFSYMNRSSKAGISRWMLAKRSRELKFTDSSYYITYRDSFL